MEIHDEASNTSGAGAGLALCGFGELGVQANRRLKDEWNDYDATPSSAPVGH